MHTLYVINLTFIVLLAHQEYLYSNHYWNKSLITQWVLYITNECVNKDKKVELYVVEKGKMPNSLSKRRRVYCSFLVLFHSVLFIMPIIFFSIGGSFRPSLMALSYLVLFWFQIAVSTLLDLAKGHEKGSIPKIYTLYEGCPKSS